MLNMGWRHCCSSFDLGYQGSNSTLACPGLVILSHDRISRRSHPNNYSSCRFMCGMWVVTCILGAVMSEACCWPAKTSCLLLLVAPSNVFYASTP